MKKLLTILAIIVLFGLYNQKKEKSIKVIANSDMKQATIGLVISTLDNPFFTTLKDSAELKAIALGHKIIVLNSQNSTAKEVEHVAELIGKKVDVLLINPVDSNASSAIKLANNAKIPVVTIDRSTSEGDVIAHIASDNLLGGRMVAEFIISKFPNGTKVVELEGIPGTSAARDRGHGFDETIKGKLTLISKQPADFDRKKAEIVMTDILKKHPQIGAVFAHNDEMALGALKAIEASGREIMVVGFDATNDAISTIKAGKMAATVAQKPATIGEKGVSTADAIIKGESVAAYIPIKLELIIE